MLRRARSASGLLQPRYRRLVVGVLMVSTFIAFEQMSVAAALPAVLRHLGDVGLYGWAFSAFMLGQVVGIMLAGPAVDRRGLAAPLLVAGCGFSIGLLVDGLAPSMPVLVCGRAVQGVGAGIITVTTNAALARTITDDQLRSRAFAATAVAWVVPSIVGPAVAGVVAQDLTWRAVFLGIVPAVATGLMVAVPALAAEDRLLKDRRDQVRHVGTNWLRSLRLAGAMVIGTVMTLGALGSTVPAAGAVIGAAGACVLGYSIRSLLPRSSELPRVRQRAAMMVGGLAAAAFFGTESFLPLCLNSIHHRSLTESGTVLTMAAVAWTAGSWLQVRVRQRLGSRLVCICGLSLIVSGVLLAFSLEFAGTPWWIGFIAWGLAPAGMGLITTTTMLVVVSAAEGGPLGEPVAALQVLVTLGTAICTGVGGASLFWSVHLGHGKAPGLAALNLLTAVLAALGLLAARSLPRPGRSPEIAVKAAPGPASA